MAYLVLDMEGRTDVTSGEVSDCVVELLISHIFLSRDTRISDITSHVVSWTT